MEEIRHSLARIKYRESISGNSYAMKMVIIVILLVSVIVLNGLSEETAKSIIFYWAGFMFCLMMVAAILDIKVYFKMKEYDARHNKTR